MLRLPAKKLFANARFRKVTVPPSPDRLTRVDVGIGGEQGDKSAHHE
jgi:hypothetical protein